MSEQRMTAGERHLAIVRAALPLFARKGFANTTTKDLAEAAGVSEALLYKHFPSKESLYGEIQNYGCQVYEQDFVRLSELEPSTSTLVHIMFYLMYKTASGKPGDAIDWETRNRLVLNSCLEDGSYARLLFQNRFAGFFGIIDACLDAAMAAGDLVRGALSKRNRAWFAHHVAAMMAILHLPPQPVIDYDVSREEAFHQMVWFTLRGMGLTDEALAKYYHPKALSLFFGVSHA